MPNAENMSKEFLGLEAKYWKAMRDHDLDTALELTDFPCVIASARGAQLVDQKQFEKMFNSKDRETIHSVEFDKKATQVRMVSPDLAVIAYQLQTKFAHKGKDREMKAVDTSTWINRGGKWACAMHTEIEMAKP